jgi:hypothetical protein
MRVELLRGSEPDLLENYVRLEGLRPGLGDRFYRMLDLALARLRQFPESAPVYQGAYRRLILRPFLFISDFLPMVPPSPRLRRGKKALVQAMTCRNADRKLSISDFFPIVRRM